jgi:hypothetical protein
MRDITNADLRFDLAQVGERSAEVQIKAAHFDPVFDLSVV